MSSHGRKPDTAATQGFSLIPLEIPQAQARRPHWAAALAAAVPPCIWSEQPGARRVSVMLCILSGAESQCCQGWLNKQMLLIALCIVLPSPSHKWESLMIAKPL